MSTAPVPARERGLDHDLFPFRRQTDEAPFTLPGSARIALAVTILLQRFHLDAKPAFAVPGMLERPYPDLGNASQRDVALRDGVMRLGAALERHGIAATFVVESDVLPVLVEGLDLLRDTKHAVAAGGLHAAFLHSSALAVEEERAAIRRSKDRLEQALGREILGWRSPGCSQSRATPKLLAEEGFLYCGDFNNDDRPYLIDTDAGALVAMPMHHFSSDLHAIVVARQNPVDYAEGYLRGIRWLRERQEEPNVVVPLVLHPWISGVPHRIGHIEALFAAMAAEPAVVALTADAMARGYRSACRLAEGAAG